MCDEGAIKVSVYFFFFKQWSGQCAIELVKKEGLYMGLFRGIDATIGRESINVNFLSFDCLFRTCNITY